VALAAVHGEFEVCFTIRPDRENDFLSAAGAEGWSPVFIGSVDEGLAVSIRRGEGRVPLDTALMRNLAASAGADPQAYIGKLLEIAREAGV
jgi:hypothetical protein